MNGLYLKYLCKKNRIIFSLQVLLCIVIYPLYSYTLIGYDHLYSFDGARMNATTNQQMSNLFIYLAISCVVFAILTAKKYTAQNQVDFFGSLPITRKKLLITHTVYNWIQMMMPAIIACLIVIVKEHQFNIAISILTMFFYVCLITTFLYVFLTFIATKMNCLSDIIVVVLGVCLLLTLLGLFLNNFLNTFSFGRFHYLGIEDDSSFVAQSIMLTMTSPFALLLNLTTLSYGGNFVSSSYTFVHLPWIYIVLYLTLTALFVYLLCKHINHKKFEECEQKSNSFWGYPLMIGLLTFILALGINTNYSSSITYGDLQAGITMVKWYGLLIIMFLIIMFISEKGIHFHFKKTILFISSIVLAFVFQYTYVQTKGFGSYDDFPKVEEINAISINIITDEKQEVEIIDGGVKSTIEVYNKGYQLSKRKDEEKSFEAFFNELIAFQESKADEFVNNGGSYQNVSTQYGIDISYYYSDEVDPDTEQAKVSTYVYSIDEKSMKKMKKILDNLAIEKDPYVPPESE